MRTFSLWKRIIFMAIILLVTLLLAEEIVRVYFFVGKETFSVKDRTFSRYLGWQNIPDVSLDLETSGYGEIHYTTQQDGFRLFGDIYTDKIKIFIIGDSYTQGRSVSDGYVYYDHFKKKNKNIEIFAYGVGGYGSLQEYMVLDKYFDVIKPDIILWQLTDNDIINNSFELESRSYVHNNYMTRPYLENGRIVRKYPLYHFKALSCIAASLHLIRALSLYHDAHKDKKDSIEQQFDPNHPLFKESIDVTRQIARMIRKRAGDTPIVAFMVWTRTGFPPLINKTFGKICVQNQIYYIKNFPEILCEASKEGIPIDSRMDPHWTMEGNALAGDILYDTLVGYHLIPE